MLRKCVIAFLLLIIFTANAQASRFRSFSSCYNHSYVNFVQREYVVQPVYQQFVALPIQPVNSYYVAPVTGQYLNYGSANQMPQGQMPQGQASNVPGYQPPGSQYLTKEEFLTAMQDITAAIKENSGGPGGGGGPESQIQGKSVAALRTLAPDVHRMFTAKCASCHTEKSPQGRYPLSSRLAGKPVILMSDNGKIYPDVDYNRVLFTLLTNKMPKDGPKATEQEFALITKVADLMDKVGGPAPSSAPPKGQNGPPERPEEEEPRPTPAPPPPANGKEPHNTDY